MPVDLTPLFPGDPERDPAARHGAALRWFLLSLHAGRPTDPLGWTTTTTVAHEPGLPPLLQSSGPLPRAERYSPDMRPAAPTATTPAQELCATAEVWRHNRGLYPGWLVAPQPVRERLWDRTREWMQAFATHREQLAPATQLHVLFELNWRLEAALLPIWSELLPAYPIVLGLVNPFPSALGDLPDTVLRPSAADGADLEWGSVRVQWLGVAFGLIRHYREERLAAEFEAWHGRVGRVPGLSPDDKARWCYERCLFALGEGDDEAVAAALEGWPTDTRDWYWAVRRAGVTAEVGRVEEASHLLGAVLRSRTPAGGGPAHIPTLSREGWLRWLEFVARRAARVRRARDQWHTPADEAERTVLRELYRRLGRHGADPADLTDALAVQLRAPPPTVPENSTIRHGFAVGSARRTTHGGESLGVRLIPAYQFMRLSEEAGVPPSIDNLNLHENQLKAASGWFQESDSVRTQTLMFRLLDDKVIDAYLSRHRVAALPGATVTRWRECGVQAARNALAGGAGERPAQRLRAALMVAGRCAVRAEPTDLDGLWDLGLAVNRSNFARQELTLGSALGEFFTSLLDITPVDDLRRRLRGLCEHPAPGTQGFEIGPTGRWPDPAEGVAEYLADAGVEVGQDGWALVVGRQLDALAREEHPFARKAAFSRVYELDRLGLLTDQQRDRLAAEFWKPVSAGTDLPWEAWGPGTGHLALALPSTGPAAAAERVRRHVLGKTLGPVHGPWTSEEPYFDLIVTATRPRGRSASPRRRFVEWSKADLWALFGIVRAWWDDHGRQAAVGRARPYAGWFDDPTALDRFVAGIWNVLGRVVIPRLRTDSAFARAADEFVREVGEAGLPTAAVLPATLLLHHRRAGGVASALRRALASGADDHYLSALRGVVVWADVLAESRRPAAFPELPADLLREVAGAVAYRRAGGLRLGIDAAIAVLDRRGAAADRAFRETLVVGLDYLSAEAEYRPTADPAARVSYDEVPTIRRYAVQLARRLAESGHAGDPAVVRWLDDGRADPLPEVRAVTTERFTRGRRGHTAS